MKASIFYFRNHFCISRFENNLLLSIRSFGFLFPFGLKDFPLKFRARDESETTKFVKSTRPEILTNFKRKMRFGKLCITNKKKRFSRITRNRILHIYAKFDFLRVVFGFAPKKFQASLTWVKWILVLQIPELKSI